MLLLTVLLALLVTQMMQALAMNLLNGLNLCQRGIVGQAKRTVSRLNLFEIIPLADVHIYQRILLMKRLLRRFYRTQSRYILLLR